MYFCSANEYCARIRKYFLYISRKIALVSTQLMLFCSDLKLKNMKFIVTFLYVSDATRVVSCLDCIRHSKKSINRLFTCRSNKITSLLSLSSVRWSHLAGDFCTQSAADLDGHSLMRFHRDQTELERSLWWQLCHHRLQCRLSNDNLPCRQWSQSCHRTNLTISVLQGKWWTLI